MISCTGAEEHALARLEIQKHEIEFADHEPRVRDLRTEVERQEDLIETLREELRKRHEEHVIEHRRLFALSENTREMEKALQAEKSTHLKAIKRAEVIASHYISLILRIFYILGKDWGHT